MSQFKHHSTAFCKIMVALSDVPEKYRVKITRNPPMVNDMDVICCVKRYASDANLAFDPIVVLPWNRTIALPSPAPTDVAARRAKKNEHKEGWVALADKIEKLNPDLQRQRGVMYLRQMAASTCGTGAVLPAYRWHHRRGTRDRAPDLSGEDLSTLGYLLPVKPFRAEWRLF